ncbi:MAG: enoyl-CoA hydratase-related protein [Alphaproteobacteria bacterium]
MTDAVRLERRGQVAEITLDRPKANAIDALNSRALGEAFLAFRDDDELRVAIITGGGERIFSAGWDLRAAAEHGEDESTDYGRGGFELALACDLIVAAEHAEFFLPETRIGVLADAGGVQRLPRRLPYFIAMEMLLTGRRMGAAEAAGYGLVNAVVPGAEVMAKARELAATIAAGAPLAVQAIKEVVRGIEAASVEDAFAAVASRSFPVYARMLTSEDHEEGPRAFAEKREPNFKGR